MTYCEGELELMAPGIDHETDKKKLARLLEAWAEEMGIALEGYGSWTLKRRKQERGLEPDECYVIGERATATRRPRKPDLAIEVVRSSGGIDKLEVYRPLGVREVWFWIGGTLSFHALRGIAYAPVDRSELLPALDVALIARCMRAPTQTAAVAALRAAMRRRRPKTRRPSRR